MKPCLAIVWGLAAVGLACHGVAAQSPAALPNSASKKASYVPGVAKDAGVVVPRPAAQLASPQPRFGVPTLPTLPAPPTPTPEDRPPDTLPAPASLLPPKAVAPVPEPRPTATAPFVRGTVEGLGVPRPTPPAASKPLVQPGETKDIGVVKSSGAPAPAATPPPIAALAFAPAALPAAVPLEPGPVTLGRPGGLMGGASFYFVKPFVPGNTAYRTTTGAGTPSPQTTDTAFPWTYSPAAAFWLGWTPANGLGARARYFFFDESASTLNLSNAAASTVITPPPSLLPPAGPAVFGSPGAALANGIGTDLLAFSSTLQVRALDVEATYAWQGERWSLLASAGGRYLVLDQGYHARLSNNGGVLPVSEAQLFDATRSFNGGGPVAGLLGNARIGLTGFSLFSSLRGALLVGNSQERVGLQQTVSDPTGILPAGTPAAANPTAVRNSDRVLPLAEIELGVQYDLDLRRSRAFFRAGVVDQTYFDAGSATQANGNLSLFGVQFSAGMRY